VRVLEPSAAERAVARRAAESRATVPTVELQVSAPDGGATTAALVEACAAALRLNPRANAAYRDGRFELYSRVNIGVVLAEAEGQYLIPTIFDADEKSLEELEGEIELLRTEVADGRLGAQAFAGPTFTVWNAAEQGLAAANIPVVPPQAAALAAGALLLTLSCDHRILYGSPAAVFLQAIAHHLDGRGA
jgi:pyruvate dehydrogenase E2 component (dihydrolipoamide acetyltransferase)